MSYEEDTVVDKVRSADAKKQEKALKKLEESNYDIRRMGWVAIQWHLVVRFKRLWFWALFLLGWALAIKEAIGL